MHLHNNTQQGLLGYGNYYGLITDSWRKRIPNTSRWHPEAESRAIRSTLWLCRDKEDKTKGHGIPKPRAEPIFSQNIIFYSHFWIFLIFALTLSVISNNNRQEIQQYDKKEKGITHTRKHHHHRLCSRRKMCCKGQRYGCLRALGCSRRCSGFTGQKKET